MGPKSHRELVVWQKAMDLTVTVYELIKAMPKTEQYGLISQMQRAAASIPANIADRNARMSRKDYARFVEISLGSAAELETRLALAARVKVIDRAAFDLAFPMTEEVGRMLNSLRAKLSQSETGFDDEAQFLIPNL